MATISQKSTGFQVQIRRRGYPNISKSFVTKKEAERWARRIESEMDAGSYLDRSEAENTTLGELLEKYLKEVSPLKKSYEVEARRIKRLLQEETLCAYKLTAFTSKILAGYRDKRLKEVTGSSVNRDLSIISHAICTGIREWGIHMTNPVTNIRKPKENASRTRRLTTEEEQQILEQLAFRERAEDGTFQTGGTRNQWLKPIFEFALETGMRRGEILSLKWDDIDLIKRVATLHETKNGESRSVPLSTKVTLLLKGLPRSIDGKVFPTSPEAVKLGFIRAVARAKIENLRFHDLRHEAISRLFEKGLNVMEVSAISGHKTLQMLKRYTHLSCEGLLAKLG